MEKYIVGGYVRDHIMGIESNDVDYTVVLSPSDFPVTGTVVEMPTAFQVMWNQLASEGFKIIPEASKEEFLTIRAIFPKGHQYRGGADFVLARKEGTYTDGRRPDFVEIGTLTDDLKRRDFTVNAIAMDEDGNLIDPFDGVQDINDRLLRAVGSAQMRLEEDALRAVRAIRFSVTKGFVIDPELRFAMQSAAVLDKIENVISDDRIQKELSKMFRFDTVASLVALNDFGFLTRSLFSGSVSLDATLKTKGRGGSNTAPAPNYFGTDNYFDKVN